jgi:hypothetical protein
MRFAVNWIFALVIGLILAGNGASYSGEVSARQFDGTWNVIIDCAQASDGALAYKWNFTAEIRNGSLLGQYHDAGTDSSGTLSGRVQSNGDAVLRMIGKTGVPAYNVARVRSGTPFHYTANTHFADRSASGRRNELRQCDLEFSKG